MKTIFLCCLFIGFLAFMATPLSALTFQFEITSVGTSAVNGTLTITNSSSQPFVWVFPTTGDFDIMVDGSESQVMYGQMITQLTFPANSTVVKQVSHYSMYPFSPGWHTAQAIALQYPRVNVGYSIPFYVESPQSDYHNLFYEFGLVSASATEISALLSLTNLSGTLWYYIFPTSGIAELRVDGVPCEMAYLPVLTDYIIVHGDTRYLELTYLASPPLSPGVHTLTAHLLMEGNPAVGPSIPFSIENPSSVDDQSVPSAQHNVSLSPNPFRDELSIKSDVPAELSISVYNLKGQLLNTWKAGQHSIWNGRDARGADCPKGIYFLNIKADGWEQNRKVLKLN